MNASIYNFQGLSSHADRAHLLQWIQAVKDPAPQQVFVVHGDAPVTEIFANTLREMGLPAHAPLYEEVFDLAANKMLAAGVGWPPRRATLPPMAAGPPTPTTSWSGRPWIWWPSSMPAKGSPNKDLKKMTNQSRAVIEKWNSVG